LRVSRDHCRELTRRNDSFPVWSVAEHVRVERMFTLEKLSIDAPFAVVVCFFKTIPRFDSDSVTAFST
jgi:hypothetical protein